MKKTILISVAILNLFSFDCDAQSIETNSNAFNNENCLKINQIQILGTHNSYKKIMDPNVIQLIAPMMDKMMGHYLKSMDSVKVNKYKEYHPNEVSFAESLNYEFPVFGDQLDAGIRSLEIDVYHDPTGNRFNRPVPYTILKEKGVENLLAFDSIVLKAPGFKVQHISDIDFRTNYSTFEEALLSLKKWSLAHPQHIPIFIMIETKDQGIPIFPNSAEVLPFTEETFDELDQTVLSLLGRDKLIVPDDVRGSFETLNKAVRAQNWPSLDKSKGKFVFLLTPSSAGISNGNVTYVKNHPSLKGRAMFVQSQPSDEFGAFILMDNSIMRQNEIKSLVNEGFLVRTRADIETYEAKINNYSRAKSAFESGAQIISTDFYKKGNLYNTTYMVQLPGEKEFRLNPVNTISTKN